MTISELINKLEILKAEHGDLEVWEYNAYGAAAPLREQKPEIRYTRKLQGRESKKRFWQTYEEQELQDKKVVNI